MYTKTVFYFYIFSSIILCFISICLYQLNPSLSNTSTPESSSYYFSNQDFSWPIPGFHKITSYFGPRVSPTTGASSTHSGIDIAAPEGTVIYSISSGKIMATGFSGANGHTIQVDSSSFTILYCHVSPNYIVSKGDTICKGEQIGNVGPKYLKNMDNSPYKDATGKFTNGATTGPHLHLTIRKDGIAVNPLTYF